MYTQDCECQNATSRISSQLISNADGVMSMLTSGVSYDAGVKSEIWNGRENVHLGLIVDLEVLQ